MKKKLLLVIFLLSSLLMELKAQVNQWKAGVARTVITPQESMWMAGYAARDRPSEGTRHDLWAKALALEDENGKQVVLVSTDLVGIRQSMSNKVRDRLEKQYGLTREQVILNSSHTHTGPETESSRHVYALDKTELDKIDRYAARLEDQLVEVVGKAIQSLQPANVYSGRGVTRFQVNRRNNKEGALEDQTALNGPNDYAVPVIKVLAENGEMLGLLFGYSCHNTVLGDYKWSGDYAGFAQLELEKLYPGTTAMFFQGAGADQNPLPRRSPALAKQYGKELAAAVEQVLSGEMRSLTPQIAVSYAELDLKFEKPSPSKDELLDILKEDSGYHGYLKHAAKVLLAKLEKGEELITSYPYPIQAWKLGEQPVAALGGELLVGYSIALKRIFGHDLFVFGYCNDVMGYIPTAAVLKEGGYEGTRSPIFTSPWASNIEEEIIKGVAHLADEVGIPRVKMK